MATFNLKENPEETVDIARADVAEIIPDADFRFSLITLKDGQKHFVSGTKDALEAELAND